MPDPGLSFEAAAQESASDFVDMLEAGDREKTETIMERFRALRLVSLALPALRQQARTSTTPVSVSPINGFPGFTRCRTAIGGSSTSTTGM